MRWIRNPWWDGCWILSGPLMGGLLMVKPGLLLPLLILFDLGHVISPIALSWSHSGFRRTMSCTKFLIVPAVILVVCAIVGATSPGIQIMTGNAGPVVHITSAHDLIKPLMWLSILFVFWNLYHFGSQNFGIVRIYKALRGVTGWREIDRWTCIIVTILGTVLATKVLHILPLALFAIGFFSVNHWLAAIGLSSHVWAEHHRRSPIIFAAAVVILGTALFVILFVSFPSLSIRITTTAIGFRLGLGFVHFLYDRWIYKFSDTQVRETIGRDIFRLDADHKMTPNANLLVNNHCENPGSAQERTLCGIPKDSANS